MMIVELTLWYFSLHIKHLLFHFVKVSSVYDHLQWASIHLIIYPEPSIDRLWPVSSGSIKEVLACLKAK